MSRLFISAAHKSSGKTIVSVGLCAALTKKGLAVQPFKKGPDYIDPMWLSAAAGRPCRNLDFHCQSHEEITAMVRRFSAEADISLIEGNKGLHDGIDLEGADASTALAKLTETPVVLVLDTMGITRGIAPLVKGYTDFDPSLPIAGVILNKVGGPRHEGKLRAALEAYTDIPVLGAIPRHESLEIGERHLGLIPVTEAEGVRRFIEGVASLVSDGVDLGRLAAIAAQASSSLTLRRADRPVSKGGAGHDLRIGIIRDPAFCFYYPDDLEALERAGAELVFINSLKDRHLPDKLDGLFIGGGFPETHMAALSANKGLLSEIKSAAEGGLPIHAECGGLMLLCRSITWRGETVPMAGFIPGDAVMHDKPQGRGLVRLEETGLGPWSIGGEIAAHEFHYSALENLPPDLTYAFKVKRGFGVDGKNDGIVIGKTLATYSHLRTTASQPWAERFAAFVRGQ